MKKQIKQFGLGFLVSIGACLLVYVGIWLNVRFWPWIGHALVGLSTLSMSIHLIIVWRVFERDKKEGRNVLDCFSILSPFAGVGVIFAMMCAVWAIPALIIYRSLNPETPKKAIIIFSVLIGTTSSILYFLANREKFPSIADKITFFTGVILGPAGFLEALI